MKLRKLMTVSLMGVAVLTGCTAQTTDKVDNTVQITEQEGKTEEAKADETEKVEENLRIVAATVAATQVLGELDAELVGVPTTKSTLPKKYEGATQVGQSMNPDLEIVVSLDPDVFIVDNMFKENIEKSMGAYDINTFYFDTSSYEGFIESIDALGEEIHKTDEAKKLIDELKTVEEGIKVKAQGEKPTVAVLFGGGENFMLATETSYLGDLVKTVGGENITSKIEAEVESGYIQFSLEQIVAQNPDYILRFAHGNIEETQKAFDDAFAKNPAWATLDAVKEGRVIDLDPSIFGVSANIYVKDAITALGNIFYGE